jgi:arylesterase/paraoxonase
MSGVFSKVLPLGLLVAAFGAIYSNPTPFLNTFAGRLELSNPGGTTWKGHGALNNDKCWIDTAGQACEDIRIHYPSSVAFLACGYPETRAAFYPPLARHDTTSATTYHEYFLKYDIATNTTTRLKIEGLDASHDLVLHGIDLYVPEDDASKIYMFAVNHDRRGEFILLFSHVLGSDTLTFIREFSHSKIKTPNAVAATSLNSFFISNDHYVYGGGVIGSFLRGLENKFGPFKWATDIVHCTATASSVHCESVSPSNSHPSANGILLVDDGKTLMVNDVFQGTTTIYDVDPSSKKLTLKKKVVSTACLPNRDDR